MKKKILFVGLLVTIMCMFSSCLFVYADGEGGYGSGNSGVDNSKDLVIKNDLYNKTEIVRVYIKLTTPEIGYSNDWYEVYTDGITYTTGNPYYDSRSAYRNKSISRDIPSKFKGKYCDIQVQVVYTNEGSVGTDGAYEIGELTSEWISSIGTNQFNLSDFAGITD